MILIPAGMTGTLQPLDVYVFRQFRSKMQELWLDCKGNAEEGQVTLLLWLRVVCAAIQSVVVGKPWQRAFQRVGLSGQGLLSAKILKALEWSPCPAVPEILPAVGQASAMFPRRSRVNVPMWVHWRPPLEFTRIQTLD